MISVERLTAGAAILQASLGFLDQANETANERGLKGYGAEQLVVEAAAPVDYLRMDFAILAADLPLVCKVAEKALRALAMKAAHRVGDPPRSGIKLARAGLDLR